MATATARSVSRSNQKAITKAIKKSITPRRKLTNAQLKAALKKKGAQKVYTVSELERNAHIKNAFAAFLKREKGAQSLLLLVSDLVGVWASNAAFGTDKATMEWLVAKEKVARQSARRDMNGKLSNRDKKGVSASTFRGALTLARLPGGKVQWDRIATACTNWTHASEIVADVRAYQKKRGKMPGADFISKALRAIKNRKAGRGRSGTRRGKGRSAPVLMTASIDAMKKMRGRYARTFDVSAKVEQVLKLLSEINARVKQHVDATAKVAAKKKAASNVIDLEKKRRELDAKLAKARKSAA